MNWLDWYASQEAMEFSIWEETSCSGLAKFTPASSFPWKNVTVQAAAPTFLYPKMDVSVWAS